MNAQIIFHKYKDKVLSLNVLGLKKIKYIPSIDEEDGFEEKEINSDFPEKFTINGKYEVKFIGNNTIDIKASDIIAVNFK